MINFLPLVNSRTIYKFEKNLIPLFSDRNFNSEVLESGISTLRYKCSLTKNKTTGEIYYVSSMFNGFSNLDPRIFSITIYLPSIEHLMVTRYGSDNSRFYGLEQLFRDDKNKDFLETIIYFRKESDIVDFIEKNDFPEFPQNERLGPSKFEHLDFNNNIYVYLEK